MTNDQRYAKTWKTLAKALRQASIEWSEMYDKDTSELLLIIANMKAELDIACSRIGGLT